VAKDPDLHRSWSELESALNALVDGLAAVIDDKSINLLRDFIENREYGVALEWLYSIVTERQIELSAEQAAACQKLAARMGIELAGK
jgi:hypothetical protein